MNLRRASFQGAHGPRVWPLAPSPKASSRLIASECEFRGAHPSRVLAEASRLGELCAWSRRNALGRLEVRVGGTPTPTRETRDACASRIPAPEPEEVMMSASARFPAAFVRESPA